MYEVYQALGWATMMLRKKKKSKNKIRQRRVKEKRDKRSPDFTRKAQKCNKD